MGGPGSQYPSRGLPPGEQTPGGSGERDAEWVTRALAGEEAAFRAIYNAYQGRVQRYLRRVLVRSEDVEEVMQTAFAEAFRGLHRFDTSRSLGAWLSGVAIRQASNFLRRRRQRRWLSLVLPFDLDGEMASGPSPERRAIDRDLVRESLTALERLPAPQRIAFTLHDLEGVELTEIARLTEASVQSVWARVQAARAKLKKHLDKRDLRSPRGPRGGDG